MKRPCGQTTTHLSGKKEAERKKMEEERRKAFEESERKWAEEEARKKKAEESKVKKVKVRDPEEEDDEEEDEVSCLSFYCAARNLIGCLWISDPCISPNIYA